MVVLNPSPSDSNIPEFSVSELSFAIKRQLEQGFAHVRVRAECGRVTIAKSGHIYLDLKDNDAVMASIIWAGVAKTLKTRPEEGLEVIATGRITTFPGQSKYQLIIERLEPAGIGAILQQLEERKKRLASEGLFDADKKQPIPFFPKTIGVITSPTGAVIRDILHRVSDRFPTHVVLWRVLVQGEKAAAQVAHAIEGFNKIKSGGKVPRPDVLIVARGGGSIEDLWAFNEEIVVRAAYASKIPIISAVGHETDTTLIDYVSDLRAPTPTGAAEKATPVKAELEALLLNYEARLKTALFARFENARLRFNAAARSAINSQNIFQNQRQRLDNIEFRLNPSIQHYLQKKHTNFMGIGTKMQPNILLKDLAVKNHNINSWDMRRKIAFKVIIKQQNININNQINNIEQLYNRAKFAISNNISKNLAIVTSYSRILSNLDYKNVLERGFALVKDEKGKLISNVEAAKKARNLHIILQDGDVDVRLISKKPTQGDLF